jgi:deoxyribonuclease V
MRIGALHGWDVDQAEARRVQQRLASMVIRRDSFRSVESVCGVDVRFTGGFAMAACVVMSFPGLQVLEKRVSAAPVGFPYIPGLLAFREIPALIPALKAVRSDPDLIMADGQGIAHPHRCGLASHLGILLGRPSIGCAKSRLIGHHMEPGSDRGKWEYLRDGEEIIGAVVRTRASVKPLYISIGHRVALDSACRYVLACCRGFRIPEPIRAAHRLAVSLVLRYRPGERSV